MTIITGMIKYVFILQNTVQPSKMHVRSLDLETQKYPQVCCCVKTVNLQNNMYSMIQTIFKSIGLYQYVQTQKKRHVQGSYCLRNRDLFCWKYFLVTRLILVDYKQQSHRGNTTLDFKTKIRQNKKFGISPNFNVRICEKWL